VEVEVEAVVLQEHQQVDQVQREHLLVAVQEVGLGVVILSAEDLRELRMVVLEETEVLILAEEPEIQMDRVVVKQQMVQVDY
jgi:hypothetical protein